MSKSRVSLTVVGIGVLCICSWAMADAAGDYQTLFGQEEKAAARSLKASVEFAGKLLGAARLVNEQKELQVLLCEKAYEFGIKTSAGYAAAADAMKLLIKASPDKHIAAREKLLKVQQLRYNRSARDERKKIGLEIVQLLVTLGDEKAKAKQSAKAVVLYRQALRYATTWKSSRKGDIEDKIKQVSAAQKSEQRIVVLKARLEKNPSDAAVRTALVMAYIGELDKPAEAVKLLTPDVDEGLRTYVPLVARKVGDLEETVCFQLAEWLVTVAEKAYPADKSVLLGRAGACCQRYLALHTAQDAALLKGKMLLAKVEKEIGKTVPSTPISKTLTLDLGKGVTMKLVLIPAGTFVIGSPKSETEKYDNERPQHAVTISRRFYMGVTEVTQEQYELVMGKNPSTFQGAKNPVDSINWHDAAAFCQKLSESTRRSVRLPTEAEWEHACRAGGKGRWCFGEDIRQLGDWAWCRRNSGGRTHSVGQKRANKFGLYDMHGNVWEMCGDWLGPYASAAITDPQGPASGTKRICRGGSWNNDACRSASRGTPAPDYRRNDFGFRVAVDLK